MYTVSKDQIIVLGIVLVLGICVTAFVTTKFVNAPSFNDETLSGRLRKAEIEYKYFTEAMTSSEIIAVWMKKFRHTKYKRGGNFALGSTDCIGGFWNYAEGLGYNNKHKDTTGILRDLVTHRSKRRLSIKKVHANDLIFFFDRSGKAHHMGIVLGVTNSGLIRYIDINGKNSGWGIKVDKLHKKSIKVFKIPFTMFLNGRLNNDN